MHRGEPDVELFGDVACRLALGQAAKAGSLTFGKKRKLAWYSYCQGGYRYIRVVQRPHPDPETLIPLVFDVKRAVLPQGDNAGDSYS
jgi:hypothetical protein